MQVIIELPLPPSVNGLFKNAKKGRRRTDRYNAWRDEAGWTLIIQKPQRISGPVQLLIEVSTKARGDTANYEKATTDLLVKHRIIEDDNRKIVKGTSLVQSPGIKGVRITITPLTNEARGNGDASEHGRECVERSEKSRAA